VALFVVWPVLRNIDANRAAIADRHQKLAKLQEVTRRITNLQDEIGRLEDALRFFDSRLPTETEIDVILREVWVIAESKALTARSVRTRKAEMAARYNAQPITMTFEGPFEGFYQFLLGLERLPRITKVREMVLQKSPTIEGHVQADITVDIFFEK
jgi:Tfp pilus assembly protein PilO